MTKRKRYVPDCDECRDTGIVWVPAGDDEEKELCTCEAARMLSERESGDDDSYIMGMDMGDDR